MTVSSTCSVGIKDSWIKKIGPTDELITDSSASEIIDGKGKLVMPGMVDGHTHTCQQLLRGVLPMNILWYGPFPGSF